MPDCRLFNEDCLASMRRLIDEGVKADCVITDPPYGIGYDDWDTGLDWSVLFNLFDRITTDDANIIMFQGWTNVCNTIACLPEEMNLRNWIVWDRIKGRGAKHNLVSTREDILWISKSDRPVFNKERSGIRKATGGMGLKNGSEYRALSNVWTDIGPIVPWSKERNRHPTQKPLKLMERCVRLWSDPGQTVLDPFMGSGTTGVACRNLERNFIGMEKDAGYFRIAQGRMEDPAGRIELEL